MRFRYGYSLKRNLSFYNGLQIAQGVCLVQIKHSDQHVVNAARGYGEALVRVK